MGETAKTAYPRFYFLFVLLGQNSVFLFDFFSIAIILLNTFLIFKLISLYRDKGTAVLFFCSTTVALMAAEWTLRKMEYLPGMYPWSKYSFKPAEKLQEKKGFYADEDGILKIDSTSQLEIASMIVKNQKEFGINKADEVYELASNYTDVLNRMADNDFSEHYFSIMQKPENIRTEWEAAIVNFVCNPINKDGFRSIEFKRYRCSKPSILLLGDSFTWGHTTDNKTNSFADILLSKGFVVYNTGITTTDVAQYLAVAKKYIPELYPDYVVVNFYLGNDISYYKREVLPHHPTFYCTNNYLLACPHGKYLNKEESYQFALAYNQVPSNEKSIVDRLLIKTVVGTLLMWRCSNIDLVPYLTHCNSGIHRGILTPYFQEAEKRKYPTPYCNQELQQIKNIAEQHNSKFILSSIPDFSTGSLKTTKDFPDLFTGMEYVEMNVRRADYELGSGIHFNEAGHKKYAEFLDSLIRNSQY